MKVLKLLNNQNGMSLVSVMMAAAMMGGLALVMTQLGTNSAKIQRKAIESQDMNAFVNNLEKNMLNHESCKNTFSAVTGLTTTGLEDDIVGGIVNFNGDPLYDITTPTNPSPLKTWEIERIYALRVDPINPKTLGHNLQLKVALKKRNIGKSFGAQNITKTIEIDAIYNSAGQVEKCFSQMDNAVETAVIGAREEACKDIDPDATWTAAGGCVLSENFNDNVVQSALDKKTKITLYIYSDRVSLSGSAGAVIRSTTGECTVNSKRCSRNSYNGCGSCQSGYTKTGQADERDRCQRRVAGVCVDRQCMYTPKCREIANTKTLYAD